MPRECKHRGPKLIHASIRPSGNYYRWSVDWMREHIPELPQDAIPPWFAMGKPGAKILVGGIIGRCNVVGHLDPAGRFWLDPEGTETDEDISATFDRRWHMAGSYGLALTDVEPLPFVPMKGALGLWNVPRPGAACGESSLVSTGGDR